MADPTNFNDYLNDLIEESGKKLDWAVKQIKTGKNRELYAKFGTPSKSTFNNWRSHSKPTQSLWMFLVACHVWGFSEKETSHLLKLANLPDLDQLITDANEHEKELIEAWTQPLTNTRLESMLQEIKDLVKKEDVEKSHYGLIPVTKVAAKTGLDTIPPVQPLPHGSFIPFSPNPHFVGRKEELQQLGQIFFESQPATIYESTIAITGIGGIGKTQLAVEFAHRYGAYFSGGVFWVNCAERNRIPAEIANCGKHMGLSPEFNSMGLQQRQALVQKAWQEPHPRLLIFDNLDVEAEEILNEFRPKTGEASVLITSRQKRWSPALKLKTCHLSTLTSNQSQQLLQTLAPRLKDKEAIEVAEFLGHFPLALHVAGSFLSLYNHWSPSKYLGLLQQHIIKGLERRLDQLGQSPTAHELSVGKTFTVSWQRLDHQNETDKLAQTIFSHLVWCAPGEPFPIYLLNKTLNEDDRISDWWQALEPIDQNDFRSDAIRRLFNLGLLQRMSDETITIHQLLVAYGLQLTDVKLGRHPVEYGLLEEARHCNDAHQMYELRAWQPHLAHLVDSRRPQTDKMSADLSFVLARHLGQEFDFSTSIPLLCETYDIQREVLGHGHADTVKTMNLLAIHYCMITQYENALPYLQDCLKIRQQTLGEEHVDTIASMNNLGRFYLSTGDFEKSHSLFSKCLVVLQSKFGEQHFETARAHFNLGSLYIEMGDYEKARNSVEKCRIISERLSETTDLSLSDIVEHLGMINSQLGAYPEALKQYKKSLSIRRQLLSANHYLIDRVLDALGQLYIELGDHDDARPILEDLLSIRKEKYGPEHPKTEAAANQLASL